MYVDLGSNANIRFGEVMRAPIIQEIEWQEIEWSDPLALFKPFYGTSWSHCFHAGEISGDNKAGLPEDRAGIKRWSYITVQPKNKIWFRDGGTYIDGVKQPEDLMTVLRSFIAMPKVCDNQNTRFSAHGDRPPFIGGLAGFIGYEMGALFEPTAQFLKSPYDMPDLAFGYYEAVIACDRQIKRVFLCGVSQSAVEQLKQTLQSTLRDYEGKVTKNVHAQRIESEISEENYHRAIEHIRDLILSGDFYQANLSRRICAHFDDLPDIGDFFEKIIQQSDSDFSACLQFDEGVILSNSPERFFALQQIKGNGFKLIAEPIKGTIERSSDAQKDQENAQILLNSEKDRAENMMIVDLLRNDLSRVCDFDSLREEKLCDLLSLNYVHHLVSKISGKLSDDKDVFNVIECLFPCGSITGAPKVEAISAISRLEPVGRGPYCGAIGFIDVSGIAEFSVAIRTMMVNPQASGCGVSIPVGGGITLLSDSENEYRETNWKAASFSSIIDVNQELGRIK